MKINVPIVGFIIGLFMPFIGVAIMYALWGRGGETFGSFIRSLFVMHDLGGKVFTLSLLANLAPFIYFTSRRNDYAARGVFVITMLYVVFIVLLKFNFFR